MDKNELKVQALVERVSTLTATYESQAADYRVEITMLAQERDDLRQALNEIKTSQDNDQDVNN